MSDYTSLRNTKFTWHPQGFMATGFCWDPEKKEKSIYVSYAGISYFVPVEQEVYDYSSKSPRRESGVTIYTHNGNRIAVVFDGPLAPVLERLVR
jgi:hypothetical protein